MAQDFTLSIVKARVTAAATISSILAKSNLWAYAVD